MKRFTNYFFMMLLLALGSSTIAFAQSDSSDTEKSKSKECKSECKKHHKWHNDWDFSDDLTDWTNTKNPFITLMYGQSQLSMHNMNTDFNRYGFGEVKAGYQKLDKTYKDTDIIKYKSHYFDINAGTKDFYTSDEAGKLTANTLQFGMGWNSGYGYNTGCSNVILTHSFGIDWTRVRFDDPVTDSYDAKRMAYYDNNFRFGINSEAGIQAQIIPYLSVNAAYSRSLMYPRVIFWKAAGSLVTEAIGYGLVDKFVDNILKSTPSAAPIVNFILKNGIAYGMYELRKEKMNFPFGGESPLMANTFKVGLTFNF